MIDRPQRPSRLRAATAIAAFAASTVLLVPTAPGAVQPTEAGAGAGASVDDDTKDVILADATRLLMSGRPAEARERIAPFLAANPRDGAATFLLAMTHHRERNYAAAEPLMVRALELEPSQFLVHHFLGWARLHLGNLDGAAAAFERHWRLQPGEPDTVFGLGLVALESGDDALAERRFRETIAIIRDLETSDPARFAARRGDLGKCHARLGEIWFARGDLERAQRSLELALSIDPRQTTAWFALSQVNRRLGEDRKADVAMSRFETLSGAAPADRSPAAAADDEGATGPRAPAIGPPSAGGAAAEAAPARPAAEMPNAPEGAPPFTFTDVTRASGVDLVTRSGRDPSTAIIEVKGGGLAVLDHDGDGDLDILVPNGATLDAPDAGAGVRLFENLGGMRFRDATEDAGLADIRPWGMGAAVADVDADGHLDVYIPAYGRDRLLRGGPGGRFVDATEAAGIAVGGFSTAASFGDVDGDGDLDLYVTGYVDVDASAPPAPSTFRGVPVLAGPRGLPAGADTLLLNQGDGTFVDASVSSGIRDLPAGYGLAAAIVDLDDDGAAEVFVGNDSQPNHLLERGDDGRWRDVGLLSGLATSGDGQSRATMGLAIADVDGDGAADLFTTNFAGEPNTLHVAAGGGFYDDATTRTALGADSRGSLGWGCAIADLDHDGRDEILVVNGHVYPGATRETMLADERQPPILMRRRAGDDAVRFERVLAPSDDPADPLAWLRHAGKDRTLVLGDLDGDGDLDAVIGGLNQRIRVLRNDGAAGGWLRIMPEAPIGCRVEIRQGERTWVRWIISGDGYCSATPQIAHFGLGTDPAPVAVDVRWPDGVRVTLDAVEPGQSIRVSRPDA